jgi:pimeloyl-ACP methyl ester carboxylesterase
VLKAKRLASSTPQPPLASRRRPRWRRRVLWALGAVAIVLAPLLVYGVFYLRPYLTPIDPARLPAYHPFRSEQARERYLAHYDAVSSRWPVPSTTMTVPTSYGRTFVRVSGPADAPPLVLLPGGGSSMLMWAPNVAALSERYRVYALDRLGDIGRSVYLRPLATSADVVSNLDELLSALQLGSEIRLVGLSFGGWEAAEYALAHSARLARVALIAPAATLFNLPPEFAWRGLLVLLPVRGFMEGLMRWSLPHLGAATDPAGRKLFDSLVDESYLGTRSFDLRQGAIPRVLSDEELASIRPATLFMVGEDETLYPARDAIGRLARVAPRVRTELVRGAGHDLTWVKREQAQQVVLDFLR